MDMNDVLHKTKVPCVLQNFRRSEGIHENEDNMSIFSEQAYIISSARNSSYIRNKSFLREINIVCKGKVVPVLN
jgi:hypothetical protein